jgi:hypothetical protein
MGWIHDSGYRPAYAHEGYPAMVLLDGTETSTWTRRLESSVIGWRSACTCGWSGAQFYPRAEWPSHTGLVPVGVEGWESGGATFGEWERHLTRVLPELAVHDLSRAIASMETEMCDAVETARRAGLSWSRIAQAAGLTAEQAVRRWSEVNSRPAPHRAPPRNDRTPPQQQP